MIRVVCDPGVCVCVCGGGGGGGGGSLAHKCATHRNPPITKIDTKWVRIVLCYIRTPKSRRTCNT